MTNHEGFKFELLVVVLVFLGLLTLNGWIFLVWGKGPSLAKVELVLGVLAFYTFAFGLLMQTKILEDFGHLAEDMTSPNLFVFIIGNLDFLILLFAMLTVAIEPRKTDYRFLYPLLTMPLLLIGVIGIFIYAALHIVIILPIAYIGYVIVSVPIRNIQTSASDIVISYAKFFSWDSVPGDGNESLISFLRDDFDIDWAKNAEIRKSNDGTTIIISKAENSAEIMMDEKKEKAILKISDGRTYDLKVKTEYGKLNIYATSSARGTIKIQDFVASNVVTIRNLLITIPAIVFSMISKIIIAFG